MVWFKESVSQKKKFLSSLVKAPLRALENQAREVWQDSDRLTALLQQDLCKLPHCQLLYAISTDGKQVSSNVTRNGLDPKWHGQDLSQRPYLIGNLPYKGMLLSAVYLSQRSMQPCITAIQAVVEQQQLLGFIAADFHIKDLPEASVTALNRNRYQQQRPSNLKRQQRTTSALDENMDYLIYVLSTLMHEHGIFQSQILFDSGICVLSSLDDPLRYQIFNTQELMDPEIFLLYPKRDYDSRSNITPNMITNTFAQIKVLRELDEEVYLCSGTLNSINGQVGLNFSCDGTHFMSADDFLNRELTSWLSPASDDAIVETVTPN